nr:hypothetical protein CFP56_29351 [Quercus suber]
MAKDVESALSIALNPSLPDDHLIWALTSSGKFTVKSAYRNFEETTGHVLWHCHRAKEVWKELSLDTDKIMDRCPEFLDLLWYARNVKQWTEEEVCLMVLTAWGIWTNRKEMRHGKSRKPMFVLVWWIKDYLETYVMTNHSTRPHKELVEATWQPPKPSWGVHCSSFCPLCDKAIETTAHTLLHCEHAKLTWAFWCNCPVDLSTSRDMVDIALDIIAKGSPNDLELFLAVAWSIWWNRNQAIHEDSSSPPIQAWELAGEVLVEFKAACFCPVLPRPFLCPGVVIQDNRGDVLAASSKVLSASFSAEISEALAMQEGVLCAAEMEVSHAIFESDSLSIIKQLLKGSMVVSLGT